MEMEIDGKLITLNAQQEAAVTDMLAWYRAGAQKPYILQGYAGTGKAQPLESLVQTPTGPVKMGSLNKGDLVLGRNGKPTKITGVFPQGKIPTYRVTFRDKTSVLCSGDHLWKVRSTNKPWRVIPLKEMISKGTHFPSGIMRYRIPLCEPLEYGYPSPEFDPYTLGVLLGDGYIKGSTVGFAAPDQEVADRVESALLPGMKFSRRLVGNCPHVNIVDRGVNNSHNRWKRKLNSLGLCVGSKQKFIPDEYLYAPVSDRLELLRGLMDTDGTAKGNRIGFYSSSLRLATGVASLVESLGGTGQLSKHRRINKETGEEWEEYFVNVKILVCPFHLSRKARDYRPSKKNPPSRYIKSIEYVGEMEQQCISVEAEDSLYLTDHCIVTHNTTLLKILINALPVPVAKIALVAPTNRAAKVLSNKTGLPTRTAFSLIYTSSREELDFERQKLRVWEESISFNQVGISMVEVYGNSLEEEYEAFCLETGTPDTPEVKEKFINSRVKKMLEFEGIILPDDVNERQKLFKVMQEERMAMHRRQVTEMLKQDLKTVKKDPELLHQAVNIILCDEASMINQKMGDDLASYRIPMILVGDPFQLPPVKSTAFWDGKRPDAVLTKIERQTGTGAGIPIVGEQIRTGKSISENDSVKIFPRNSLSPTQWQEADQIICGTHKTRERICRFLRESLGLLTEHPVAGEKIVSVYNDRGKGIMNGELYTVERSELVRGGSVVRMDLIDPYGIKIPRVEAWTKGFGGRSQTDYLDDTYGKFWFGYAITCHQSQGSEWKHVVVCDDWPGSFDKDKWLYTAVTRASKQCSLVSGRL